MHGKSGIASVKDAWLARLGARGVGSNAEFDDTARQALVRAYMRTLSTLGGDVALEHKLDGHTTRAITTLQQILSGTHTECSVGELVKITDMERVVQAYDEWQADGRSAQSYHDVVMSALAKLRIEQGL